MSCEEIRDRIAAAHASGAPLGEEAGEHLAGCEDCRTEAGALRQAALVLRAAHVLEDGAAHRAPLFDAGPRRRRWVRFAAVSAVAAALLLAVLNTLRPTPVAPGSEPLVTWSGDARVERIAPGRIRLLDGEAAFIAESPFTVATPLATIRGEAPARFRVVLMEETVMTSRGKRAAIGAALVTAIVLVVSVESGWLTVDREDGSPPEVVSEGEEARVALPEGKEPTVASEDDPPPTEVPEDKAATAGTFCTVFGTLVYDDGEPVAAHPVWVRSGKDLIVRTDSNGRYRIERVAVTRFPQSLMLGPPECATAVGGIRLRSGEEVRADFTVPRGAELPVLVTEEGRPAPAGVRVDLQPTERAGAGKFAVGRTLRGGTIVFRKLVPAAYEIRVDRKGWRPYRGQIDLRERHDRPYRVELVSAQPLVIRIENWAEGRKGGLYLQVRPAVGGGPRGGYTYLGEVGPEGTFTGDAPPPGKYRAMLKVAGWLTPVKELTVPEFGPAEIVVPMAAGAEVRGVVFTADGKPVTSARVHLTPKFAASNRPQAKLGEDGSFALLQVPPGSYRLGVTIDRGRRADGDQTFDELIADLEVGPAGVLGIKAYLPRGGAIVGRMTGDRPRFIQLVRLMRWTPDGWRTWGSVSARPDGVFRAENVPPGKWRLEGDNTMLNQDLRNEPVEVEIRGEETVSDVEIRWWKSAGAELILRTPSGAPFTETVTGFLNKVDDDGAGAKFVQLKPDEEGVCTLKALSPGRWKLALFGGGGPESTATREFTVHEGTPVTLVLWE